MTQALTGTHLRTYFSIEIMKTSQRHPNIRKPFCILTNPSPKWFLERSLICWVITGLEYVFHFRTSEIKWLQEDTIALQQVNVRVSWLKIVDKTTWNFKFQKSCFSLSLFIYSTLYNWALYIKTLHQLDMYLSIYLSIYLSNIIYITYIYISIFAV